MSKAAQSLSTYGGYPFRFAGEDLVALLSGALYWPRLETLLVADLHLEKGSALARRGQLLPPYDSLQSLRLLEGDISHLQPDHVVCLGDSFHDIGGPDRLQPDCRALLRSFMQGRRWSWLSGNHDPDAPNGLGGDAHDKIILDRIGLTHEPGDLIAISGSRLEGVEAEIAGHLHPVARIVNRQRGKTLRRRVFVLCEDRIILPAYGSYTGGLNIDDDAFSGFLKPGTELVAIGHRMLTRHCLSTTKRRGACR